MPPAFGRRRLPPAPGKRQDASSTWREARRVVYSSAGQGPAWAGRALAETPGIMRAGRQGVPMQRTLAANQMLIWPWYR
jgi:hypothetical protein